MVLLGLTNEREQLQIRDALTNRRTLLVRVNESRKEFTTPLPARTFDKEIAIACKQYPAKCRRSVKQLRVIEPTCSIHL